MNRVSSIQIFIIVKHLKSAHNQNTAWFLLLSSHSAKKESIAQENYNENYNTLKNSLSYYMLEHYWGNYGVIFFIRRLLQQLLRRRLCGESQCTQRVHNKIYPHHLHSRENWLINNHCSNKSSNNRYNTNNELKLKKFLYRQSDVSAPFDCLNNRCKIVVHNENVSGLFCNLSSGNSHSKSHIGLS